MKITKPKSNQLLIEDDCLINLNLNVKSKTGLNDSEYNKMYEALILAWRFPNMDASKQMFYGSQIGLATLLTSLVDSAEDNKIFKLEHLVEAIEEKRKKFDKK